jgi:hypothetical protein
LLHLPIQAFPEVANRRGRQKDFPNRGKIQSASNHPNMEMFSAEADHSFLKAIQIVPDLPGLPFICSGIVFD